MSGVLAAAISQKAGVPLPTLLAQWKFNDGTGTTAADSSGNGNALTLISPVWNTGNLSFNGSSAYAYTSYDPPIANSTYSMWVNVVSLPQLCAFFWTGDDNTSGTLGLMLNNGSSGSGNYFATSWAFNSYNTLSSNVQPATGAFINIALALNGGSAPTLYVNGAQVATGTQCASVSNGNFSIGGSTHSGTPRNFYNGLLKDFRVYGAAITALQAAAIYANGPSQ